MLRLTFNPVSGLVSLPIGTIVKPAEVPVEIRLTRLPSTVSTPGVVTLMQLSLVTIATPPGPLAFLDFDEFTKVNDLLWRGTLLVGTDQVDTYMSGKLSALIHGALVVEFDGVLQESPNFELTLEHSAQVDPESVDGAPVYLTAGYIDTDVTLAANSDSRVPSQKAVKAYVTAHSGGGGGSGTVTSVNASGGSTGFTFTGGPITGAGTLTMSLSDEGAARTALGLSTSPIYSASETDTAILNGVAVLRDSLGNAAFGNIGETVQAWDARLDALISDTLDTLGVITFSSQSISTDTLTVNGVEITGDGTLDQTAFNTLLSASPAGSTTGTNTGDQNLSGYAALAGATFTGGVSTTSIFAGFYLQIGATGELFVDDSGNLTTSGTLSGSNLTGTNTGDQNLSGYAQLSGATFSGAVVGTSIREALIYGATDNFLIHDGNSKMYLSSGFTFVWTDGSYGGTPTAQLTQTSAGVLSLGTGAGGATGELRLAKLNKVTITQPATGSTITLADGKTLTASNTLTLAGTDGSTLNVGAGGTLGSAAFTASTAYEPTLTISTGLTRTTGTLSLNTASTTVLGGVKVDGTTITISGGVISATGGTINGTANQIVNTSGTLSLSPTLVLPGTLTAGGAVTLSPVSGNVVLSPTGTGVVTINPATAGTVNNVVIGGTTPLAGSFTTLSSTGLATLLAFNVGGGAAVMTNNIITNSNSLAALMIQNNGTGNGLVIRRAATGSPNALLDLQSSAGSSVASVDRDGNGIFARVNSASGSAGGAGYGFTGTGGGGVGMFSPATNTLGLAANSVEVLRSTGTLITANVALALAGDFSVTKTVTTPGTTGAVTINKTSGRVNFAAAATSLVVTNSFCTANSIIQCMIATNDATATGLRVVAASGSFTIYLLTAPTAETAVNFSLTN